MTGILKVDQIQNNTGTAAVTIDGNGRVGGPKIPAWKWSTGNAHGSQNGGTAHDPLQWNDRMLDTDGAGGNLIKSGTNHTLVVPVTGLYWVSYGGIKGASTSAVGRMHMSRSSGTGDAVFPQCRGEENSPYAQMAVAFVCNAVAGDEWYIQTQGDGMWMGGSASTANGYNDPYWTGYLIG